MTKFKHEMKEKHALYVNKWYMDFTLGAVGAVVAQLRKINRINKNNT